MDHSKTKNRLIYKFNQLTASSLLHISLSFDCICSTKSSFRFYFFTSIIVRCLHLKLSMMMKQYILILGFLTFGSSLQAQFWPFAYDSLEVGNLKAYVRSDGALFEYNIGQGLQLSNTNNGFVTGSGMWIGGLDAANQLHISIHSWSSWQGDGFDYWPGPLAQNTADTDSTTTAAYDRFWKIDRAELDAFQQDFQDNGVIDNPSAYPNVYNWPAFMTDHLGNTLSDAAPWVDVDGDPTAYTPDQGDYPLLKGDAMLWWVFNDVGPDPANDRFSPDPLGVEVHAMIYGFDCDDTDLHQNLFVEYQLVNRSSFSYQDVYLGQWTDFDMGGFLDDYVGVDTLRDMFYGYNGDNNDNQFGANTPALGVQFLRGGAASPNDGIDNDGDGKVDEVGEDIGLTHFMTYPNNFVIHPVTPVGHYGILQSIFPDTLNPLIDHAVDNFSNGGPGNGHPDSASGPLTNYLYPGNICQQSGWTMANAGSQPLDIRGIGSSGPFGLAAGATDTIVMAFSLATGGNYLQNACALGPKSDYIRDWYEAGVDSCVLPGQVFPGDANHDRVADVWDILPIGLHYLSSGPARPNASLNWVGQNAPDWTDSLTSGVNLKHVDTDGNGTIELDDTLAIGQNYGLTHLSQKRDIQSGGAPLYFTASATLVNPGDTVSISVWLGTADTVAQDVYGIAFSMDYDTSQVASISVDMSPTWLGTIGQNVLAFSKNLPEAGQLDIAQVRLNQSNISGYGRLANIIVVMDDDIAKQLIPFSMSVNRLDMIDSDANALAVSVEPLALNISTDLESPIEVLGLSVYPNPAQDYLQIYWQQAQETRIRLLTSHASVVLEERSAKRASTHTLNLSELPQGIYLLEVRQQNQRSLLRVVHH